MNTRFSLVFVVLLGMGFLFLDGFAVPAGQPSPSKLQLPESKIMTSFKITAADPQGIVMVSGNLWLLDARGQTLLRIDPQNGKRVSSLKIKVENPRGLAWDGKHFWCGDNKLKLASQIDPFTGKVLRSLKVPIEGKPETAIIEAMAFDKDQLWVAYAAGYSSRILRMNAQTGEVVQSMFANCYPKGIATDGKRLWVTCYNRGQRPSVLSVRTIMDDADKMNASRVFLARTPGFEPTGIAFDGQFLWLTDKKMKLLHKIMSPSAH